MGDATPPGTGLAGAAVSVTPPGSPSSGINEEQREVAPEGRYLPNQDNAQAYTVCETTSQHVSPLHYFLIKYGIVHYKLYRYNCLS